MASPDVYPNGSAQEDAAPLGLRWLLSMGAILGSLLVFVGLQVADSHAPVAINEVMVSSGVQTMSATELIQTVKAENRTVYWLSSKLGDSYSNSSLTDGVDQISYRPVGSNVSDLNQFDVMVGTYKDFSTYDAQPHPLLGANSRSIDLGGGTTLTYSTASPNRAIVAFASSPEIVVLNYPAVQPVPTLINDAQNLVTIS